MKYLFKNAYIAIDKILELHPFTSFSIKQYEESQRDGVAFHSLFSEPCVDHVYAEDVKLSILGQDVENNGFTFIDESRIEFDQNSDILSGYVQASNYEGIPVPEGSKIVLDIEGEPEKIHPPENFFKKHSVHTVI